MATKNRKQNGVVWGPQKSGSHRGGYHAVKIGSSFTLSDKSTKDLAIARAMIAKALALLDGIQRRAMNKR